MKNLFVFLVFLISTFVFSQETCESKEETIEDLNSITKCTIKESKKSNSNSRQISVKVSASKNRFLKKRTVEKKAVTSGAGDLNACLLYTSDAADE